MKDELKERRARRIAKKLERDNPALAETLRQTARVLNGRRLEPRRRRPVIE